MLSCAASCRSDEARTDLETAIERVQELSDRGLQSSHHTFNLALYHLAAGEAEEAGRLYQEALADGITPHSVREAVDRLSEFLDLFPSHSQARAMRDLLERRLV